MHLTKLVSFVGIIAILICCVIPHQSVFGEDKAAKKVQKPAFVDLDGDGFDDNATPENQTSPIDSAKSATGTISDTTSANTGFFDLSSTMKPRSRLFLDNSGAFAYTKQRVSCGLQHRGGFGSGNDFGASNDVASGAVIGGVCVGGVCH